MEGYEKSNKDICEKSKISIASWDMSTLHLFIVIDGTMNTIYEMCHLRFLIGAYKKLQ